MIVPAIKSNSFHNPEVELGNGSGDTSTNQETNASTKTSTPPPTERTESKTSTGSTTATPSLRHQISTPYKKSTIYLINTVLYTITVLLTLTNMGIPPYFIFRSDTMFDIPRFVYALLWFKLGSGWLDLGLNIWAMLDPVKEVHPVEEWGKVSLFYTVANIISAWFFCLVLCSSCFLVLWLFNRL